MGRPTDSERMAALRLRCMDRKSKVRWDDWVRTAQSLHNSANVPSWQVRKGLLTRDRLSGLKLALDKHELLLGRAAPLPLPDDYPVVQQAKKSALECPFPPGQSGHCELDLGGLFAKGVDGVRGQIEELRRSATGASADAYQSFLYALDGLSALAENAAGLAESTIAGAPDWRQGELREMSDACRRIAHFPPATFRQAIQLIWLCDLGVMYGDGTALVVPGHLDRTLWPYYQADLAAARMTKDQALLLIESLYVLINEYIYDGLAMSVMVGGRDEAGHDVTNELSYLCLEAIRRTRLIYPTVGICWHEGTPQGLVDLAIELISKGYPTPAFFGDLTIQKGLRALGVPASESHNYINSTCVEITPVGSSGVWVATPYFNVCKFLLEEIAAQASCDKPVANLESFIEAYFRRLDKEISAAVDCQNDWRRQRMAGGGKPLQSVLTRDCLARGRDMDNGGAVYNWVECSFVGLANLADSLVVIREEIFNRARRPVHVGAGAGSSDDQPLTFRKLHEVLGVNFAGHESLRMRFLNGYPKYGNASKDVDALVGRLAKHFIDACAPHKIEPDGSPFVPGTFCWIMHEWLGRETGATPDGRQAGFPFADGGGPAQGREKLGPTAAILSATSWPHQSLIGGLAYNMKFNSSLFGSPQSLDCLRNLVVTYLRRGGFETQINVVDHATLVKARANPEQYRDLAVRIGGYVDYFTRLSPEMQEEVMLRTEFAKF